MMHDTAAKAVPIAIVGMAGLFPDATNLDEFWAQIISAHCASRRPPKGRWLLDVETAHARQRGEADHVDSPYACFLDDALTDVAALAALDWPPEQLEALDPMFRLLLRVGQECWDDAALADDLRARCGVIFGNLALPTEKASAMSCDYLLRSMEASLLAKQDDETVAELDGINAHAAGLPARLLAQMLKLGGTHYTLDAACASSLYAIALAMDELRQHRADVMIAGGLSRPDSLYTQMGFSQLQALSPSGRPAPFDAAGDGLVVGEGCGLFVLRRLQDAVRDGNHIYGVIHAVGLSNDRDGGILAPESEGQQRAMRAAYAQAGWSPTDVQMIECHAPGTPVGDVIEFSSMNTLWQQEDWQAGQCVIGSVKSNIGHLLTAAGAAALMKTLLAMQHGVLPPTANFKQAADGVALNNSPFRILQQGERWPLQQGRRRAAVSAFGFGGINAHLLLESWHPDMAIAKVAAPANHEPLAVVSSAAHCGPWSNLSAIRQRVFVGDEQQPQNAKHWWGIEQQAWFKRLRLAESRVFAIDNVAAPLAAYRIPPHEMAEMLPRQMLMLNLAAEAFSLAGVTWQDQQQNIGVFIGCGLEMQACNYAARWDVRNHADRWRQALGLQLDDVQFQQWVDELREWITPALNAGRTTGALGSTVASRIAKAFRTCGPAFTIAEEPQSGVRALEVAIHALRNGSVDMALVGAVDMASDIRLLLSRHAVNPHAATPMADGGAALVLKRLCDAERDGDHIQAVIHDLHASHDVPDDAWQQEDIHQRLGDAGVSNGLLALLMACESLYHAQQWPTDVPQAWIQDRAAGYRRACLSLRASPQSSNTMVIELQQAVQTKALPVAQPVIEPSSGLFVLRASSIHGLRQVLEELTQLVVDHPHASMHQLACWHYQHSSGAEGKHCLTLVADHRPMLTHQLKHIATTLADSSCPIESLNVQGIPNRQIQDRVFYSAQPLAKAGKLAFVFAGSGNHFAGMGRDLLAHWSTIIAEQEKDSHLLRQQYLPQHVWQETLDDAFYEDHNALVISHVALGTAISDVLRGFAIEPTAAMGYSLGESTSLFSLGVWRDRDAMIERLKHSTLFTHDLAGACEAARKQWALADDEAVDWKIGMVAASAEAVRTHLPAYPHAYLLIVNTPQQCVVGGQSAQVMALVNALGCHWIPLQGVTTVHCEVVTPVAEAYRALHEFDTYPSGDVTFYRFADGQAYTPTREAAADAILSQAMHSVDFTHAIEQAWNDGVRIFLEIGPGQSCSRMIHETLGTRAHMARSSCYAGEPADSLILRTLAHLLAEGVAVDLAPLYAGKAVDKHQVNALSSGSPMRPTAANVQVGSRTTAASNTVDAKANTSQQLGLKNKGDVMSTIPANAQAADHPARFTAMQQWLQARGQAHGAYLQFTQTMQSTLLQSLTAVAQPTAPQPQVDLPSSPQPIAKQAPRSLNRAQCMEFAIGSIAHVLGESFAEVDAHPTRVRLPDEPLMLVDRILDIEGKPRSMSHGRVVTEHDVTADRWYLDGGHIPTCVAVEAGQADLFLSAYLGIDFITQGKAVYRLLDAVVTFHHHLPAVGDVIHYDIHIDEFFRQGDTWLFRFHFESTVNGQPLMSMQKGCAGFFTEAELAAGQGIIHTRLDLRPQAGILPQDWHYPLPLQQEAWNEAQIAALYDGDLAACFGAPFDCLPFTPYTLPAQQHLKLVDRVVALEPQGGRYSLGQIRAEMDIHPDDWFLTCHFVDDQVMPGTLMYECCMHTLRIFLLRMGWVGAEGTTWCEPVPGIDSGLKCRGQVTASCRVVTYQVDIREMGYAPEPYVIANALMYADGKPIVEITQMSARLCGLSRQLVEGLWQSSPQPVAHTQILYDTDRITAFAIGKPSYAFGDAYRVFDQQRKIARLPGPPFQFLDRIIDVHGEAWQMQAGAKAVAEYDVPANAWYFAADRQANMPFSVLLETGLQPCGWLAAYVGSALTSDIDLSFRNLDGHATQYREVNAASGTLTTTAILTRVSSSGGMIIQNFDFEIRDQHGVVYAGDTVFGFFSREALAQQVGVRGAQCYQPNADELACARSFAYPEHAPYPDTQLRMIDHIDLYLANGGAHGLGFIRGSKQVNAEEWFFKAHFFEDPVCPGSLGLESFLQLLKVAAIERWGGGADSQFECVVIGQPQQWNYRGQVIPENERVTVEATITHINEAEKMVTADGYLSVDGKTIYQMQDFTLRLG